MKYFKKESVQTLLLLFLLLLVGGVLRFYNLNWDEGHFFHPDERNIANAVSRIHFFDQLNPGFFAYGGLMIYLYRAAGELLASYTQQTSWVSDWGYINVIGRFFSALFATITIFPIYLLTKALFDKKVALTSAFLFTFSVFSIQMAHFGVTESFLAFIGVAIALSSLYILRKNSLIYYLVTGILLGLATAAKTTGISLIIFPLFATFIPLFHKRSLGFAIKQTSLFVFLLVIAFLVFFTFSPYTFLDYKGFSESMQYESGVVTGKLQVPYTWQFEKTWPYLYQLFNVLFQLGPLGLLAFPSFIVSFYELRKKHLTSLILFASFPIIYFAYVGSWHTKFIRYMVPILPFFVISISYTLTVISKLFSEKIEKLFLFTCIFITAGWALAFFSIYTKPQTRIVASEWMYKNFPPNSKILGEHWDDGLPIPLSNYSPSVFQGEALTLYDLQGNHPTAIQYLASRLSQADFIIINSRRLYGTLLYLPEKFPIVSRYYKLLFAEKLGYYNTIEFSSYPTLFGLTINDDISEETFQVYEHPKVIIFRNEKKYSKDELIRLLQQ